MNTNLVGQDLAFAAMKAPKDYARKQLEIWKQRRDFIYKGLTDLGFDLWKPEGAFYVYPKCATLVGKRTPQGTTIENDADFAHYLLDEARVAVVPGSAFGLSPFIRLSYAIDKAALEEAVKRIATAVKKLS